MKETDHPWIRVTFNENDFSVYYDKSEEDGWVKTYNWKDILKICFKSYDYGAPNFAYVFFRSSDDTCIIPIHGNDNENFWQEIKNRGLFNASYEIHADTSQSQYHCWPKG
jgi:hypothetical protein